MKQRVLVTGATGFCGTYLCEALAAEGYEVFGTYLKKPSKPFRAGSLYPLDIKRAPDVLRLVRKLRPHSLFHLAAQSSARDSWKLQSETFEVNVGATINLLSALRTLNLKTRMVFISSIQVYGRAFHGPRPVREDTQVWPENPYAASKRTAELACLDFFNRFASDVVIARVVNHAGPGQDSHYVFSDWCRQIALAEKKGVPGKLEVGNLKVERDFLHVRDVVSAYLTLLRKGKSGEIYNVASGKPVKLQKYADFLSRRAKVDFKIIPRQDRMRSDEAMKMKIDHSKIKSLGWKPVSTAAQALAELLDDWRGKAAA